MRLATRPHLNLFKPDRHLIFLTRLDWLEDITFIDKWKVRIWFEMPLFCHVTGWKKQIQCGENKNHQTRRKQKVLPPPARLEVNMSWTMLTESLYQRAERLFSSGTLLLTRQAQLPQAEIVVHRIEHCTDCKAHKQPCTFFAPNLTCAHLDLTRHHHSTVSF